MNRHRNGLMEGCRYQLIQHYHLDDPTAEQTWDRALTDLNAIAERQGQSLANLGLPMPTQTFTPEGLASLLAEEMSYDKEELAQQLEQDLGRANIDQSQAATAIINSVDTDGAGIFFLDGPGGTGKTFVEKLLLAYVRSRGQVHWR